jgi:hypothetical protein
MLARPRVVFSSLFMLLIASAAAAQAKRAMTVDDVIDLVQVSAPRISPDGRRVIYTPSELGKWKDNKRVSGGPEGPDDIRSEFYRLSGLPRPRTSMPSGLPGLLI